MDYNLLENKTNDISASKACIHSKIDINILTGRNIQDRPEGRDVNILILPSEILQDILLLLDVKSIIRMCITNKNSTKYLLPPVREYSDRSKYLNNNYFWSRFVSGNYDPIYYGVESWTKENLEILLGGTVNNVWLYFLKLIIYGKHVPIYFFEQVVYMKIHYEDTIEDIWDSYFKKMITLSDKIYRNSSLSIFTNNMRSGDHFNIVFSPSSKKVFLYNIHLYNDLLNRRVVLECKPDYKFNLCTSSLGRKLFYDKLLIQAPHLYNDPYNQSIREPLIPELLNFKLYSQRSDSLGCILYRYK
jgi:hypothetical protein